MASHGTFPPCGSKVVREEPSLEELAWVIKAGTCIEANFQRGKGEAGMDEYGVCEPVAGLVQCLGLLCVPGWLPPFGFGSVTVFDLVLPRASPSQRPACGTTAQASSYSPSPPRDEGHQARGPWERVPRFIA